MTSMPTTPQPVIPVIGGVDCHADTHHAVALDDCGRRLGDATFPATTNGYQALLSWLHAFGEPRKVGVESTSAYGAGLTRYLLGEGIAVMEVNQPHPHTRRRRGKSDPIDAEAAARKALSGEATAVPKDTTGIVEAIRLLRVARSGAVKAHTAALHQLRDLLLTAPDPLRRNVQAQRKTLPGRVGVCARLRPDPARLADPTQAAKLALRASLSARSSWTVKPALSTSSSPDSSGRPLPAPASCSGSAPPTPANCWSPPARTSTGCAPRPPSRTCAPPTRSRPPQARPPGIGSTTAATGTPTPRYT
jgi:Transposase